MDIFRNELLNISLCRKMSTVKAFSFKGAEEILHGSVVARTNGTRH